MNLRKNDVNVSKFTSFFLAKSRILWLITEFHNFLVTILIDYGIILSHGQLTVKRVFMTICEFFVNYRSQNITFLPLRKGKIVVQYSPYKKERGLPVDELYEMRR